MLYVIAVVAAFLRLWLAGTIDVAVALLWLVPDRCIERIVDEH